MSKESRWWLGGCLLVAACAAAPNPRALRLPYCELHYHIEGSGPPLVLVHGAAHHGVFLPTLRELTSTSTLVFYDQRGWGRTRVAEGAPVATLETDVADIEALRRHLGYPRIDLLALSNGGPIALDYALRHPGNVRKLVLMSTYADNGARIRLAQERCARVIANPDRQKALAVIDSSDRSDEDKAIERFLLMPSTQHHRPIARATAEEWVRNGVLGGPSQPEAASDPDRDYGRLGDLHRIQAPTLVVAGRHDCVTPLPHSEEMALRLPHAELAVLGDSGHLAHLDEPEQFLATVRSFLAPR